MKRIKPLTKRLPRTASVNSTSDSAKQACSGLEQSCCEATSGCVWRDGYCKAS